MSFSSRHVPLIIVASFLLVTACAPKEETDEGEAARIQAIGESRGGTEDDLAFVREKLVSGNAAERTAAAWTLGRAGGPADLPGLLAAMRKDPDRYVRINAVTAVGALGGPAAQEALVEAMERARDDTELKATALRALGNRRYLGAYAEVAALLQEENPEIRELAASSLADMGEPQAVPFLEAVVGDPVKDVRSMVAFALGKLGDPAAVPEVLSLLADEEWEVRANAAQALGMIGDPSAKEALEKAQSDPSGQVQAQARRALGRLQG